MGKTIGIDLGTTNSCVSIYEGNDYKVVYNKEGKATTPSVVAFTDKGEILIGETAKRQAVTNPENTIYSIKRIMGLTFNEEKTKDAQSKVGYNIVNHNDKACIKINDKIYTPQEISAKILQKLKRDTEDYLGGETVVDAVITVPAYFNDAQRKATQEAGKIAGLNVKRIINEPTAASLAYGLENNKNGKIIVYDLGGGTFDVTVLEIDDGTYEVLSSTGDSFLGGDDFDNKIIQWLLEEFKNENGIDISQDKMVNQRLKEAAENAKKELSSTTETEINLPFLTADQNGPKHLVKKLTRAKLESMIIDLIDKTKSHIENALKEAGLSKNEINEIVMVGGSTRIPKVQEMVKEYFGKELNKSVNPDEVVAIGAAVQGSVLSGEKKDILLLDVTPLNLGIEVMGGVVENLVEKNTTLPVNKNKVFSNAQDNQPQATIHVLQGNAELANQNKSLGQFNIELTPAPRGTNQIEVIFDIDSNGVLNVKAIDKANGKENSIQITGSSNLSDEEINRMMKEAEMNNQKEKEKIEAIKKRNELDNLVFQIEKTIKEQNLNIQDIPGLENVLNKGKKLTSENSENKSEIESTINELNTIVSNMQNCQSGNCNNTQQQTKKDDDVVDAEIVDDNAA